MKTPSNNAAAEAGASDGASQLISGVGRTERENRRVFTPREFGWYKVDLPEEWQLIRDMATAIRESKEPPPSRQHLWPIWGLARRSANMARAILALLGNELWVECLLIQRPLLEVEITARWLLQWDAEQRLKRYIAELAHEKGGWGDRVARMAFGQGDGSHDDLTHRIREPLPKEWGIPDPSGFKRMPSVKQMATDVDLQKDYEVIYWIESSFIHASPLAVIESHPSDVHHQLCSEFTAEKERGIPRFLAVGYSPFVILRTFALFSATLKLGLEAQIERASTARRRRFAETQW